MIRPPRRERTRVQHSHGWRSLKLRAVWEYRELLYFLAWRDVKVRYKQAAFGIAWAVLQPLALMLIFSVFFGHLAKVPSNGLPYPIFAYVALVPWTLFSQSLTTVAQSVVENATLVSKVSFPRLLLPIAATGACLLDFVIAMGLVFAMMAYYDIGLTAQAAFVPVFAVLALVTALGVGIWLAALNVRYRDVRYALTFLAQAWLFLTPVAYPSSIVPAEYQTLYGLNPMAGVVEGFRWALLGSPLPSVGLIVASACVSIALLVGSVVYFQKTERSFADVI